MELPTEKQAEKQESQRTKTKSASKTSTICIWDWTFFTLDSSNVFFTPLTAYRSFIFSPHSDSNIPFKPFFWLVAMFHCMMSE